MGVPVPDGSAARSLDSGKTVQVQRRTIQFQFLNRGKNQTPSCMTNLIFSRELRPISINTPHFKTKEQLTSTHC